MRKTYPLAVEGKHPDRVLDAVKHDIRKYLKRERAKSLPQDVDYWDFDCRTGTSAETAQISHVAQVIADVDQFAKAGAQAVYVELLAKPGVRQVRPAGSSPGDVLHDLDGEA